MKIMDTCPHCHNFIGDLIGANRANHTRWCDKNPKRASYLETLQLTREKREGHPLSEEHRKKISNAHTAGKYSGASEKGTKTKLKNGTLKHTEDAKRKISEAALKSKHRRLRKSCRVYITKTGEKVLLDSRWEELLAIRLDSLNVEWCRPHDPVEWIDTFGQMHNYFPDFYLPAFDIYLDPKNPFARASQKEKLDIIQAILPNLIIIESERECATFDPNMPA
jgi:hypothetical protein